MASRTPGSRVEICLLVGVVCIGLKDKDCGGKIRIPNYVRWTNLVMFGYWELFWNSPTSFNVWCILRIGTHALAPEVLIISAESPMAPPPLRYEPLLRQRSEVVWTRWRMGKAGCGCVLDFVLTRSGGSRGCRLVTRWSRDVIRTNAHEPFLSRLKCG